MQDSTRHHQTPLDARAMDDGETPWPICTTCVSIPFHIFSSSASSPSALYPLQVSFHHLRNSALAGCHTCTLFYEATREPFKSKLESAPVYIEHSSADILDQPKVVVSADLARITRREDSEELKLCEELSALNLEPFKFTPIAEVKFVSSKDDVPAAARHHNSKCMLPEPIWQLSDVGDRSCEPICRRPWCG